MLVRAAALAFLFIALVAGPARADLYSAQLAYEKGDFETAYKKYRELAELGQPSAQLNVAIMHGRGEGVPQNMTFAYAWASIAAENGQPRAQRLADEVRPVLTPGSIEIADEMRKQYGRTALDERLMPKVRVDRSYSDREPCRSEKIFAPHYPEGARRGNAQGRVYAEFTVMPDGRARHPRIMLAVPPRMFDEAVRTSLRRSTFHPALAAGKPVPCKYGMFFTFTLYGGSSAYPKLDKFVDETKEKAESGDINSQMLYGMLLAGLPQVGKDRSAALPWFLKAAQAGAPYAQYQVGASLLQGWGCECEENKALVWLRKAAEADEPEAQVTLASYALRGTLNDANVERARVWLERAAAQDHREAKVYLSALLAAAPSDALRDPKRALTLLDDVFRKVDDDPIAFEIRAAASAAIGDFDAATKDQMKAVAMARKLGWDLAPHQERLERYLANQPWYGDLLGMAGTVEPI